jgi:peptide/nickel transport system substrate-binding protein
LRYFTTEKGICAEPEIDSRVVGSGRYRLEKWDPHPERSLRLLPIEPSRSSILFSFVQDSNSRLLRYVRGQATLTQNGLSLTKTRYVRESLSERYRVIERDGISLSYLAFNVRDPILSKREVRQALALAIDRQLIVDQKLLGFCKVAPAMLSPLLPESAPQVYRYDPSEAEALLDRAGFARGKNGVRFELNYRTTPNREGLETALLFQNQFERIGVRVVIESVEQAVFLSAIRAGKFQLYSSRWIGASDGSLLYRILRSGQPDNRVGYQDAEVDRLLDQASAVVDLAKRVALLRQVQAKIAVDLPYFPLWTWNNAVIARRGDPDLDALRPEFISLSGALDSLFRKLP